MPPAPKKTTDQPPGPERRLIQTTLNFPRAPPRPAAASSPSASSSGTSSPHVAGTPPPPGKLVGGDRGPDGLYRNLQWLRDSPAQQQQKQRRRNIRGGANDDSDGFRPGARVSNRPRRSGRELAATAAETVGLIPGILALHPIPAASTLFSAAAPPPPLDPAACPGFVLPPDDPEAPGHPGTRIRVIDGDSFDIAFSLGQLMNDPLPVLVLNLANARTPGGGWLQGAMAQEEELCFRSTLSATLTPAFYPHPAVSAIYSPEVIVFRSSVVTAHTILPPHDYKRVAVLSAAAQHAPALTGDIPPRYAVAIDRVLMRNKIRLLLHTAAHLGHRRIVLGALGCGVFAHPCDEVAALFMEVFMEPALTGGWWRDVVFAVLDTETVSGRWGRWGDGPYGSFWKNLDGFPV